jgi:hypothetical protein
MRDKFYDIEMQLEQIMTFLNAHAEQIKDLQDGIEKCFDRIELIEKKLQENHIGE